MNRLEGVLPEGALGNRHAIHALDAILGRASHSRKSRQEMKAGGSRSIESSCKLCSDIAAQN